MRHRIVGLGLLALGWSSSAQAAAPKQDYQQWVQVFVDGNLDRWARGLRLSLDLHARRMNAPLNYQRDPMTDEIVGSRPNPNTMLILRPAIGYQFARWGSVFLGYAWVPNLYDDPTVRAVRDIDEHRIWEQLGLRWAPAALELSSRTRLEERVRTNGPGSPENDAGLPHWALRLRQQVRVAWTLVPGRPWQLVAADELFLHLNETNYPARPGIDQNRAFLGLGYDTPGARVEVGYLNVFVQRFTDPNQLNHALAVNVVIKLGAGKTPEPAGTVGTPTELTPER